MWNERRVYTFIEITMKVTDLTHLIYSDMPVFPGTEQPLFKKGTTLENDGFRESKITLYSHTGTHIDAISIDEMKSEFFEIHKIFLQKNTIIIENLCNLDSIGDEYFTLSIMPFKNQNADGSPVRAVSIVF